MTPDGRYFSRQLVLNGFGASAQKRLARSRVLVAGLGGTGCIVATDLSLAGVGHMTIVDRDVVSVENLHRQPIYSNEDLGIAKAEVAAGYLSERGKGLTVDYSTENLGRDNASSFLDGVDLAVDCLDGMDARLALNAACATKGIPMVHTGAIGWEASVAVLWASRGACLECVFPVVDTQLPTCEEVGVLGAVTSVAGSLGALEAVKLLARVPSSLLGRMLYFDGRTFDFRVVDLQKRSDCAACGSGIRRVTRDVTVRLCGVGEYYLTRAFSPGSFTSLSRRLGASAIAMGDSVILLRQGRIELSLFRTGNALVKGARSAEEASDALDRFLAAASPDAGSGNA